MKCTLAITQRCDLACDYCYIHKKNAVMPLLTARKILDFVFSSVPESEKLEIGFFGGEPLLEFNLIRDITSLIQDHLCYDPEKVTISITTNGTIFSKEISDFIQEKNLVLCISCDGPPVVQDRYRHFPDGRGSSTIVESNIRQALKLFPMVPVNAVYSPGNLNSLPDVVEYLASLGIKNIYLNPNISAQWTGKDAEALRRIYGAIGKKFQDFYLRGEPKYINLIDSKIAVILRGGYRPLERCRMGTGELAFAPSGNVYRCERFIGNDDGGRHCLGNIHNGFTAHKKCDAPLNTAVNQECQTCTLNNYCMNWCGCTNYFGTGSYHSVSPFICASEKAAIEVAFQIVQKIGDRDLSFSDHLSGTPLMNTINACRI